MEAANAGPGQECSTSATAIAGARPEANTRRRLEDATERAFDWTRIGMTEAQTLRIAPIWKVDGRDCVEIVRGRSSRSAKPA